MRLISKGKWKHDPIGRTAREASLSGSWAQRQASVHDHDTMEEAVKKALDL